ncbi:hypothetical protein B0T16DRAFT_492583 [Cercophora newfieldiana]|uniref:BTB domain-containing protein n=1 Tax=Cercophora newfieldiana TaxID=92897 RepID=A0AA40CQD3_9PEZI|nr:hypothetical protein B0T16DRAFT_492583 [Cercophora newfieldiana]
MASRAPKAKQAAGEPPQTLTFEDIASSKPFRFTVGPQKREFTIHPALVANQSLALERLVNGNFKEAQECHSELESVDEETFIYFIQFAYTGSYGYKSPLPEKAILMGDEDSDSTPSSLPGSRVFRNNVSAIEVPKGESYFLAAPGLKKEPDNAFLSHAKVFIFADFRGVARLRGLALQRLGNMLKGAQLTGPDEVVEDVAELMEYCYEEPRPVDLTKLLSLYAACKVNKLWRSETFRDVFSQHKELSLSLVGAMVQTA